MTDLALACESAGRVSAFAKGSTDPATATPPACSRSRRVKRSGGRGIGRVLLAGTRLCSCADRITIMNDACDLSRPQRDDPTSAGSVGGHAPADDGDLREPLVGARGGTEG